MSIDKKIKYIKKNSLPSKIGRKPIIFIDHDDVCNNFIEQLVFEFNEKNNTNFTEEDITCWDISACLNCSNDELFKDKSIFSRLKVRDGCYKNFKLLFESNLFEMYILSAAHPYAMPYKFDWVTKELPFFDSHNYLTGVNKSLYHGDILFDDSIENAENFKYGEAIIFSRPHNKQYNGILKKMDTWEEFANYILDKFYL